MMHRSAWCLLLALLAAPSNVTRGDEKPLSYETDIRPILKTHCFQCHGETGEKEGGLDLRLRRFIVQGGESGAAITPGKNKDSLLLERVRSGEMPPGDDKRLSQKDIDRISAWIAIGAPTEYPEPENVGDGPIFTRAERSYWAFQPVKRPPVPEVRDRSRVLTPIDAFIIDELERRVATSPNNPAAQQAYQFAETAEGRKLIRRASFDLLGLPPTPAAIAKFDADTSPDAWDKLIGRLLDSPHYGERWGRHWLDIVGYADSEGYSEEDRVRPNAYRYRDYVIRAFNADKPFDRFIQEQLAGDEMVPQPHKNLSADDIEKLTATGFLRMAPDGTASDGIDQPVARNQVIADTLQIVGTSLLGLTVNCAQCHDHRYDPIPQADYYRLRSIFDPAFDWQNWKAPPARRISLYTDADRELARQIEIEAAKVDKERLQKAEVYITRTLEEELLLLPEEIRNPMRIAYRTVAKDRTDAQKLLLKEYPTVAKISVGSLYLYDRRRDERARKLDVDRKAKEKRFVAETVRREIEKLPAEHRAEIEATLKTPPKIRTPEQLALLRKHPGVSVTLTTLAKFNAAAAAELERDKQAAAVLRASKAAADLKRFSDKAAKIRDTKPEEGFLRALTEQVGKVPSTFLFYRGDHEQPKEQLQPADLSILSPGQLPENDAALPTTGRRLAWAKQLTDGRHPLVARVIVNRIWLGHFGRGLVDSPGDFGFLGERPTHPRLLDWLADEFVRSGWKVKHIHRLIMSSAVYRQSSAGHPVSTTADPDNRLYTRFPIQRLESEEIRDAVLAVSGKLNLKLYGKPVPVMEDEVGQIILGIENLDGERKPTKPISLNGEEFRRGLYVQVRRSRTLSIFEAFDAPNMSPNCERRNSSNVPTQSLMLMNSDFAIEYSQHFAQRLFDEAGPKTADQIALAWKLAFSTEPTAVDVSTGKQFVELQQTTIRQQLPKADDATIQRRAMSTFCQALLSSNRFLYVD
jgi:mono/diheme cytochrome c family protein/mRNA-degrading endonuclease RelE of RelBE toxin-antitoxin system